MEQQRNCRRPAINILVKTCIIRMTLFISYALIGAWIFTLIEKGDETNSATSKRMLMVLKKRMESKLNMTLNVTDFDEFVADASVAMGISGTKDWTFLNACAFTLAAITTIGYGDITPKTAAGQGFVIPFCLIGLPLTMMTLKTGGELVLCVMRKTTFAVEKRVLGNQNPRRTLIKCSAISIVNVAIFICIMAVVEMYLDEWTFVESLYCWFVTFSTIGFGDYVPLQNYSAREGQSTAVLVLSGMMLTIPYITGLCLVSCLLNVLLEGSEYEFAHFKSQIRSICKCKVGEDERAQEYNGDVPADRTSDNGIRMQDYRRKASI